MQVQGRLFTQRMADLRTEMSTEWFAIRLEENRRAFRVIDQGAEIQMAE